MIEWFTSVAFKAIVVAVMALIAHKWSTGALDKRIRKLKGLGKQYGVVTVLLLVVWWVLLPSGFPDDFITLWLITKIGLLGFIVLIGVLTIYLIWRMRVTIVIYKN